MAVHILIFGEMAGFKMVPYIATLVKKSSKVCYVKVCHMKKYCILLSSVNTWRQYQSRYIIKLEYSSFHDTCISCYFL